MVPVISLPQQPMYSGIMHVNQPQTEAYEPIIPLSNVANATSTSEQSSLYI